MSIFVILHKSEELKADTRFVRDDPCRFKSRGGLRRPQAELQTALTVGAHGNWKAESGKRNAKAF